MKLNTSQVVVITTINTMEHSGLKKLIQNAIEQNYLLIIVGDKQTDIKFNRLELPLVKYYDVQTQLESVFHLAKTLPLNHYARKNIGYLYAAQTGFEWISETDDDNCFYPKFWDTPTEHIGIKSDTTSKWVNVYKAFGIEKIWHRGIPIDKVPASNQIILTKPMKPGLVSCVQGMADGDPDVDAICRILFQPQTAFPDKTFVIDDSFYAPTNSQLTRWHVQRALALLYLPSTVSWRVSDIWRGLIAQRFFSLTNMETQFKGGAGYQLRNNHDLLKDFIDEFQVHRDTHYLLEILEKVKTKDIYDYMTEVYSILAKTQVIQDLELKRLSNWVEDVQGVLNSFPSHTSP